MNNKQKHKQTRGSEIPEGWKVVGFEECIRRGVSRVGKVKKEDYNAVGKYPIIDQSQRFIAGYTDDDSLVYSGNLPVIIFGDHTRVFKFVDFPFVCGADGTKVLLPDRKKFDPRCLFYFLLNTPIPSRGYNRHYSLLRTKNILCPPLDEQPKIASILSTVDEAIEKTSAIIQKTKMLKRGLMQRLLTRGIGHIGFKQTELGEIPKTWKVEKLENLIKITSGNYFKYSEFVPDGVKVLKIDNVSFGEISWESKSFLPVRYIKSFPDLVLEKNDIVIALNRPVINDKLKIGLLNDMDIPSILYQRVGKLVNQKKTELIDLYLYYVLSSPLFIKEIKRITVGTDQPYINPTELIKLKIGLPPKLEQVKIISILREIDTFLQREMHSKELFIELRKGLMEVLLSGKVRVKVA